MRALAYVDVDGTLTVEESDPGRGYRSCFVRDSPLPFRLSSLEMPTARESWDPLRHGRDIFLSYGKEALGCLNRLRDEGFEIVFVSALPPWAIDCLVQRMNYEYRFSILGWRKAHPHKAQAVDSHARGVPAVWFDDKLTLDERMFVNMSANVHYVEVDNEIGLSMHNVESALRVVDRLTRDR